MTSIEAIPEWFRSGNDERVAAFLKRWPQRCANAREWLRRARLAKRNGNVKLANALKAQATLELEGQR